MNISKTILLSTALLFLTVPQAPFAQDKNCGQKLDSLLGVLLDTHPQPTDPKKPQVQVKNPPCLSAGLQALRNPASPLSQMAETYGPGFKILIMNLAHWFLGEHKIADGCKLMALTGAENSPLKELDISPEDIYKVLQKAWMAGRKMNVGARQAMWKGMEQNLVGREPKQGSPLVRRTLKPSPPPSSAPMAEKRAPAAIPRANTLHPPRPLSPGQRPPAPAVHVVENHYGPRVPRPTGPHNPPSQGAAMRAASPPPPPLLPRKPSTVHHPAPRRAPPPLPPADGESPPPAR